ncbi:MAG: lamin tail domain-containing protein [Melioribacteraceae bacterium]|nr:lamin tail domain-containing protein [Melioribacteraceae bacterium]
MKKATILVFIISSFFSSFLIIAQTGSSITFSEIMFYPLEPNGEFVEIYNTSTTETIDIANFKFKYYTSSNNNLLPVSGGTLLGPGKFAVIVQGNYDYSNGFYKTVIPPGTIVMKTSGNSFGSSGMANTTSREINLINSAGQTIDAYTYSANNSAGIPDEKISLDKNNGTANWSNGNVSNGTPGKKNSVSPTDYDLSIDFMEYSPIISTAKDSLFIKFVIKNLGRVQVNNFSIDIYYDSNSDSTGQQSENIFSKTYASLAVDDSTIITVSFFPPLPGDYRFLGFVIYAADEKLSNNNIIKVIAVADKITTYNEIVINEIMYAPTGDEPEWIEVFNNSMQTINLKNWRMGDNSGSAIISSSDYPLAPKEYLVISKDAIIESVHSNISKLLIRSIPTLNNSGDNVILRDLYGRTIDSTRYSPLWGGNTGGKSLERKSTMVSSLDQSNWGSSISRNRSTPGEINSISQKDFDLSVISLTSISPYAETGKELVLNTLIKNTGVMRAENFEIRLYRDENLNKIGEDLELISQKEILALEQNQIINEQFTTQDFTAGTNQFIISINFIFDEFPDNNSFLFSITGVEINEMRGDLVINEIMYAPNAPEPEWIEVYNRSTKQINMLGYKIADDATITRVINSPLLLSPGNYLVIAKDSSIVDKHGSIPILTISNFSTLNNSHDCAVLLDSLNRVIDSLDYKSTWGGTNGNSLERIDVNNPPTDSSNWKTSKAIQGSTPGRFNSVTPYDYNLSVSIISHSPLLPVRGDSIIVTIGIDNVGKNAAQSFSLELHDDINYDSTANSSERIFVKNYQLLNPNSSITEQIKIFADEVRLYRIIVKVNFGPDEVLANNTSVIEFSVIEIPASRNEIVINEIMYAPAGDEPEWIELYNRSNRVLNLKNWKLGDNTALASISTTDYIIEAGEYLLISSESNLSSFYNIPSKIIIVPFPGLSNTGDDVKLKDNLNRTIDSLKYLPVWGGTGGKSLERKCADSISVNKSNWGSSISKFRATPGTKNSITQRDKDLAIRNFRFNYKYAYDDLTASALFWIMNIGIELAEKYQYKVYNDFNNNQDLELDELINEGRGNSILSKDSVRIEFVPSKYLLGENIIYVAIEYEGDENPENDRSVAKIIGVKPSEQRGDLVINEIMYLPNFPEPEWIEIFNKSNKIINLKSYWIADYTSKASITQKDFFVQSGEYIVISRDTNILSLYTDLSKVIIATIPSLNNGGDRVVLSDSLNRTIDSLDYKSTWGGTSGKSLERIDTDRPAVDSTNWKTATAERGTPGKINSVSKKNFDVRLTNPRIYPEKPLIGESVNINVAIWNPGKNLASFVFKLYEILEGEQKILLKETNVIISPLEDVLFFKTEMEYQFEIQNKTRKFEYFADFPLDEDTTNNRITLKVQPGFHPGSVVINEIMYNPVNGEPEWIELYNNSEYDIDLEGWSITDILTTPVKTKIQSKSIFFPGESLLVIAKDGTVNNFHRSIPSQLIINTFANLNNDADGVVIKDVHDVTIDSVRYDKSWGGESGKSLERKSLYDPSNDRLNWSSSKDVELSTPGRINSIYPKEYDLTITGITIAPLYAAYDEDVSITAQVFNNGLQTASQFSVNFYFITGNDTSFFSQGNGTNLSSKDSMLVFSVAKIKLDNPRRVYCKVIYTEDMDTLNNYYAADVNSGYKRNSVVVSEIMYNPLDDEPEWIEIVNNSTAQLNLKDWKVTDLIPSITKVNISNKDLILEPGEYAILTPDTNKFMFYPPLNFLQVKFGSLGNANDGIALFDFRGAIIDSVIYSSKWGGTKGFSLERISLNVAGTDSINWITSLNQFGATPGFQNSITFVPQYQSGILVINEIMFDPATGNSEFIEFYNTSTDSLQIGGMNLICGGNKKIPLSQTYYKLPPHSYLVFAHDSSLYGNYNRFMMEGNHLFFNSSLSLSNEGAEIVLRDSRNTKLDSVYYSPNWHNRNLVTTKNRSLERLNPLLGSNESSNWSSSVEQEGASPCKANSVFTETVITQSKVIVSPNPFSPDNDGFEDFTTINFNLAQRIAQVRIKVFDSQGRLVRTVAHNRPSGPSNSVIFNGLDDNNRPLKIGIYILLIEIVTDSGESETLKLPVVVARKL